VTATPEAAQITVDPFPVAALAALFDDGLTTPRRGDPLPPYWHLAACEVPPATGELGPEGHSHAGPVTPPPDLPRRMFAGGRLRVAQQARVGDRLERVTRVIASTDKQGRSGPLRFVTVEARLARPGGGQTLVDEHDIVYRPAPGPVDTREPASQDADRAADQATADQATADRAVAPIPAPGRLLSWRGFLRADLQAGPVALQRFSAATSNAHRIHYDHPYVTAVEGYPGLLVHGTLLLLSLLELVRLDLPERAVTQVSFRARSPVFAGDRVELAGELTGGDSPGAGVVALTARHTDGRVAMSCTATFG
jgi:3-methylfumaryl-CoA hydratase